MKSKRCGLPTVPHLLKDSVQPRKLLLQDSMTCSRLCAKARAGPARLRWLCHPEFRSQNSSAGNLRLRKLLSFWNGALSLWAASSIMSRVSSTTCERHFPALKFPKIILLPTIMCLEFVDETAPCTSHGLETVWSELGAFESLRTFDAKFPSVTSKLVMQQTISCIRS